jgi:hypothetical protein
MKRNGHDAATDVVVADGASLPAAADEAGGVWANNGNPSDGAHAIRHQLDQMRLAAQAYARRATLQTQHQIELARWRSQADQAQAILVDCLTRGDHDGAAQAMRAMTQALLHLIRLGAE